ncbi:holin, partial [Neglecta sp. X4]
MKQTICTVTGITGSVIAGFFGGWTSGMTTLLICMIVDYITGLIVAGVFGQSP